MGIHGARYIHIFVPCPLGWGSAPEDTIKLARLAVEIGTLPAVRGASTARSPARTPIRRKVPVDRIPEAAEALSPICSAIRRDVERIARIQAMADHNIAEFGLLRTSEERTMEKPFAITLDAGSSLANKTGAWRTKRPLYVDRLPPCNHACPAGENIQGWLYHAESGDYEAAWRGADRGQPAARDHGPRLLSPLRDLVQPRQARRAGRHQFGRALPRRRGDQATAGSSRRPRPRAASACSSSAPDRRGCPPPITCGASATASRSSRPVRWPAA